MSKKIINYFTLYLIQSTIPLVADNNRASILVLYGIEALFLVNTKYLIIEKEIIWNLIKC